MPVGEQTCAVLAVARCERCERAVCTQHRYWRGLCTVCYQASPEIHCQYCLLPWTSTCHDCGSNVCSEHMVHKTVSMAVGPDLSLYQSASMGRCTRCRDAELTEELHHQLACKKAEDGLAPFPALRRQDLGLRPDQALPTPGDGQVRFDGLYERTLHGRPGEARARILRILPDGRMFAGNYGMIGTSNVPTPDIDMAMVARHLPEHADAQIINFSVPSVGPERLPDAGTAAWVDTEGNLILETISIRDGKRRRAAALYRFVPLGDLPAPGPRHVQEVLTAKEQYKVIDLRKKITAAVIRRSTLESIWRTPLQRPDRSMEKARLKALREIEELKAEETSLLERVHRIEGSWH